MKITIEQDGGKQLSLETVLTIIPPGHSVLICPANKDYILGRLQQEELQAALDARGIKAVVVQMPVCVWAISDATA